MIKKQVKMKNNNKARSREDLYKKLGVRPELIKKSGVQVVTTNKEKELLHNHQYHVSVKSLEEIHELVELLKVRGYRICHNLDNVLSFDKLPVGLCIDNGLDPRNGGKCIFTSNVTCMACYCSWSNRRPLTVKEVIDNIVKLIDELDINFYNNLLSKN